MDKIVVTRHKALYDYLLKTGHIDNDTEHISKADPKNHKDIEGKHVYGILPNWLACHAGKFTEVQLNLPPQKRNDVLTVEDVEWYAIQKPKTYTIREVKENE